MIELMIAIAVVAILAAIAVPSFIESVRKGRRADAVSSLLALQQAQERWRTTSATYTTELGATGLKTGTRSADGHYDLAVSNVTSSGYTATATARSDGPQAGDAKCKKLVLTMSGGSIRYTSINASDAPDTSERNACWNR